MPLLFEKGDITKLKVDAIVNAANSTLLGGGGVDGCIHRAAGPELLLECAELNGCATGDAKITMGYRLPAKHVIHTVGPVWQGGNRGEKEALTSCYRRSLEIAKENGCQTVAFPLISAGAYGYPKNQARDVAIETIRDFLAEDGKYMTVYLVFYDGLIYDDSFNRDDQKLRKELERLIFRKQAFDANMHVSASRVCEYESNILEDAFIDRVYNLEYIEKEEAKKPVKAKKKSSLKDKLFASLSAEKHVCNSNELNLRPIPIEDSIDDELRKFLSKGKGKSFSEKLLEYIVKRGITNAECYRYANVSRQIFSNIISSENYVPKKHIVLGFAIALQLNIEETKDLLESAGFALSDTYNLDKIVSFFIEREIFDIFRINAALQAYDEKQLGAGY